MRHARRCPRHVHLALFLLQWLKRRIAGVMGSVRSVLEQRSRAQRSLSGLQTSSPRPCAVDGLSAAFVPCLSLPSCHSWQTIAFDRRGTNDRRASPTDTISRRLALINGVCQCVFRLSIDTAFNAAACELRIRLA